MADLITLDVLERPDGGRRVLCALPPIPGIRHRIHLATARFVASPRPSLTLRRVALITVWEPGAETEAQRLPHAKEHWHVLGELTRASFDAPWRGWMPDTDGATPLDLDEPALVFVSGDLRARGVIPFIRASFGVVGQAFSHPGYLGGLSLYSSLRNTTSCSAWRTYADARDYAFSQGPHLLAMHRDRVGEHHRTHWFSRIRPLQSRGTLDGRDPFARVLGSLQLASAHGAGA
jgi:hypothetical protein